MSSPNMLMRDPVIYRVLNASHPRTKNDWVIFPMYDWTHGESDYIEQISHSLCTLEFKPHRDLYEWFLDSVCTKGRLRPKQREHNAVKHANEFGSARKPSVPFSVSLSLIKIGLKNQQFSLKIQQMFCKCCKICKNFSQKKFAQNLQILRSERCKRMHIL